MVLNPPAIDDAIRTLIRLAVEEDLGSAAASGGTWRGDQTVALAIPEHLQARSRVVARKAGVISGTILLEAILRKYAGAGGPVQIAVDAHDGKRAGVNQAVATLAGAARTLLSAERVVLNFLSHLSGVATLTRQFVDAVASVQPAPAICDTRKTTPGYRALDKYAVRCGGGVNHRMGLYDGVMLKDNHLEALRERLGGRGVRELTLGQLAAQVRQRLDPSILLWLEVDTLEQLHAALEPGARGADIILLDNFTPEQMREAVRLRDAFLQRNPRNRILLEASGGITLANVGAIAQTGVDRISIGALTHSAPILDLSMEFVDQ